MAWLLREGEVLATLELAGSLSDRMRGLVGRNHYEGALLLRPARSVHSVGMRFAIDVAFCDAELVVTEALCLRPYRMTLPRLGVSCVLEAGARPRVARTRAGGSRGGLRAVAAPPRGPAGDRRGVRAPTRPAGTLVLVATPIGNLGDLSPRAVSTLGRVGVIACEDTRRTRRLLTHAGVSGKDLLAVHDHNEAAQVAHVLRLLDRGVDVAVVTDAGTPGISDPGAQLLAAAAAAGARVEVVPGPSAAVAALVVSGLPGDRFCFEGFLPRKGRARADRLGAVAGDRRTSVIYEAPPRVAATLADLADACGPLRRVAVVRELTKLHEEVWRGTLEGAAARARETAPRGEHVLVVAGAAEAEPASDDEVAACLAVKLAAGVPAKEAVPLVAAELDVPKRRVYDASVRLRR